MIKKSIKLLKNPIGFLRDISFYHSFSGNIMFSKRKKLYKYFSKKITDIYKRKTPSSDKYPFIVHDTYSIFEEDSGYEKLFPVGENWLEKEIKKPIALMIGFNDWKFGFTADYLPEYRTIFTSRKFSSFMAIKTFYAFKNKPSVIVVWGYTESYYVKDYAKRNNIPLYRMEDGFVRSSELGASHSTPYSLILDKRGLYYNPEAESDIEHILNNYNFKNDIKLMKESKESLELLIELKISKYNQATISNIEPLGIKLKKRVVILGQVDNDAAIRFANYDKWTSEELVKLARYENPEADVYYRPHPEVYKGYQKSRFRKKKIEYFAKVLSPEEPLIEFLETMDHVYVINSLSGFEALMRGKKVTVVGAAFYAGWGLTDDRLKLERREKKLSLEELFAGIYLKYPRYLANLENSNNGLFASSYRISADKYAKEHDLCKSYEINDLSIIQVAKSEFWPQLFLNSTQKFTEIEERKIINTIRFDKFFNKYSGDLLEVMLINYISGAIKFDNPRDIFIKKIRTYISSKNLNELLTNLLEYHPGNYIYKHIKWLLEEYNEHEISSNTLERYLQSRQPVENIDEEEDANKESSFIDKEDSIILYELLETYKANYDYANMEKTIKKILLFNYANTILFVRLAEVAVLKTDLNSARSIGNFLQKLDISSHNRAGIHLELENFNFDQSKDSLEKIIKLYLLQIKFNPDRINRSWTILKRYFISDSYYKIFASTIKLYEKNDIHKAVSYMELNEVNAALKVTEKLIISGNNSDKLYVIYAQILFTLGKIDQAISIIKSAIKMEATHANYTEYLRILKALGNFDKALEVAEDGLKKKIELTTEGHIMPIYFGLGRIEDGFKCFLDTALKEKLVKCYGEKRYRETNELSNIKNLLLIFSSGPAEEIRFSSMYEELSNRIGVENFKLTCDYRLKNILSRTFPKINFIPVKRTRFFTPEYPSSDYNNLPSSELCTALDNNSLVELKKSHQIKLVSELFYNFRKTYSDFHGKKYLKVDEARVNYFKDKLPKDKLLIGISWRSILTNAMRNIHYLSIEDLKPIFDIPNICFVNLQYDECQHELDIIRDEYNVDIIDFHELDQMNDFDGVAGLMKNLDLVISPFTAVLELAGSIGVNSLLFSNHGESHWRKKNTNNVDVWYNSVKVIGDGICGEKNLIVTAIINEIRTNYIKDKNV